MKNQSQYFNSIRIGAKKDKKQENTPICCYENCQKPGLHKAPAGRDYEGQYLHFCLEHVREYNKNFNYFADLKQEEISRLQREALLGSRPTWSHSTNPDSNRAKNYAPNDFIKIRSGSAAYQNRLHNLYKKQREVENANYDTPKYKIIEIKAFKHLELKVGASAEEIRTQYKNLIKIYHPDTNGGDRSFETRLREVLQAYKILKKANLC